MDNNAEVLARLSPKFDKRGEDDCWPWLAGKAGTGYGMFWLNGKMQPAHRVVYIALGGVITRTIRHTCDNPACVNPKHMLQGTQADNIQDAVDRARFPVGTSRKNTKLTKAQVREIKAAKGSKNVEAVARLYSVTKFAVYAIWQGRTWRYL